MGRFIHGAVRDFPRGFLPTEEIAGTELSDLAPNKIRTSLNKEIK
jgi:hypothetical protein